ncbi:hypothetical protein SSX86_012130 [Deinandra increscens subsp. villosa]|uniref:Protein transport protein sec16 n=1 Tax=Deinandra increscens subsp. villosa TaxID=3103831 RepID=A0AAP0DB68_9ASTR
MASRCNRFMNKASFSNLKSAFMSASMPKSPASSPKFPLPSRSTASPVPRFSVSRCPSELGCVQSLLPLHSAVAAARLTSCLSTTSSCRSLSQGILCCTSPVMCIRFLQSKALCFGTVFNSIYIAGFISSKVSQVTFESNPPLVMEDTDEDFFDKLVDDVDDHDVITSSSSTIVTEINNVNHSDEAKANHGRNSVKELGKVGKGEGVEDDVIKASSVNGTILKDDRVDPGQSVVSSNSYASGNVVREPNDVGQDHGTEGGSGVKEVQWSAFTAEPVDNGRTGTVFGSYSDFFTEFDGNVVDPTGKGYNFVSSEANSIGNSSHVEGVVDYSHQYQEGQAYSTSGGQSTDGQDVNSSQYWENLYPGWKYDANTGQWYQVDESYNATSNAQITDNASSASGWTVSNVKTEVAYLQQTTQSLVAEKSANESVMSWSPNSQTSYTNESLSNWSQTSQVNTAYPPHFYFDPQYPGWYYDMNVQEWRSLDAYNSQIIYQNSTSASNSYYGNEQLDKVSGVDYNWNGSFGEQQGWQPDTGSNFNQQQSYGTNFRVDNNIKQQQSYDYGGDVSSFNKSSQVHNEYPAVSGAQSFGSNGNFSQAVSQSMMEQNKTINSTEVYESQNQLNYSQQSVQQSGHKKSYGSTAGRSSAGQPPHALVTFGFGGKLIVMKDTSAVINSSYGGQDRSAGTISVLNLVEIVTRVGDVSSSGTGVHGYFHTLCRQSFPGPLAGGNVGGKELIRWIDERITQPTNTNHKKDQVLRLLLSLLKIALQHYGKLRSPFGTDTTSKENDAPDVALARLFASAKQNSTDYVGYGSFSNCMQRLPSEGLTRATAAEVQTLLVSGRKMEALHRAQAGQLWGIALILAAQLGDQFYVDTVRTMALHQLVAGSPLRTLCLLIAGQPADVFSTDPPAGDATTAAVNTFQQPTQAQLGANAMLDDWEENLAVITANRTKDDELVLIHLGDCLWKETSNIIAAHICYLVAEANFEPYSDSARLCLIGADHWKHSRTYASPESIQRTEVYEYSKLLGNSQFTLLPFQPYKLVYAYMLAEVGKISDSLKYCQVISKSLKTGRAPEVETWRHMVSSLEERIKTHQQGGFSTNLAPGKLVGKLLNLFDSTAHRVVGGLPPPVPSTSGSSTQNEHCHKPNGPRVSSSQSTMAMSSLVPSASMEPITQNSAEGNNRRIMHNRSVSEPDFGRSPRQNQVDSSKESSADSQGKASSTSRFGRFRSQLFEKTLGLLKPWPDKQAKLGETNKFHYDEKLKRWVEEGVDPPAEEAALAPPPTMTTFQNGTPEYPSKSATKSAAKSEGSLTNGSSEFSSSKSSGIPPIPATSSQFSARGRTGVRASVVISETNLCFSEFHALQINGLRVFEVESNPPLVMEDTDEDFFDKLVDDVDDHDVITSSSSTIVTEINNVNHSDEAKANHGRNSVKELGKVGKGEGVEDDVIKASSVNGTILKDDRVDPGQSVVSSNSYASGNVVREPNDVGQDHGTEGGSGVKEVQWSAFTAEPVDNGRTGTVFGSYSDFFTEFDGNVVDPTGKGYNFVSSEANSIGNSSHVEGVVDYSHQYQEGQAYSTSGGQSTDGQDVNSSQYWENLYPGWKYDANTGQWYQVDESYNATSNAQITDNASSASGWTVSNVKTEVAYLQQTTQSLVAEKSANESVMSWSPNSQTSYTNESLSNWSQTSQVNTAYPPHFYFDPQYPGWYYDMNVQEWRSLDAYNSQIIYQNSTSASNSYYGNEQLDKVSGVDYNWNGSFGEQQGWQPDTGSNFNQQQSYGTNFRVDNNIKQQQSYDYGGDVSSFNKSSQVHNEYPAVSGAQSFGSNGNFSQAVSQSMMEQNKTINSTEVYESQNQLNYSQQSVQQSGHKKSYGSTAGRSSAGQPPHALVTFGFGGKLIVMKDTSAVINSSYGGQDRSAGTISVLNLVEIVTRVGDVSSSGTGVHGYFHTLCRQSFPGPLAGGNVGGKELIRWIDERITQPTNTNHKKDQVLRLLLSLLKIALQHYGKLRSPFGTDTTSKENDAPDVALARLFASAKQNSTDYVGYGSFSNCMQRLPSEGLTRATAAEVQTLLVSGRKMEALHRAQAGQLWGIALILAAQLGDQFYVDTVRTMALHQLVAGSPLRTLCLLIAGQPADVFSTDPPAGDATTAAVNTFQQPTQAQLGANAMLDDWEENLAVITANRTKDDELVLIHLGDCLWKETSNIIAAHICYLVAEANFEPYSDSARLCLIGADHWKHSRTYASPESIQRTEVYEYSKLLGNSQFTLLPFQPYKLVYAYMLAEVGKISDSLKYCQVISKSLKTGRAPEVETWRHMVSSLEERIKTHQQGGFSTNLAPGKLVGKLLNLFDSTAHRVVGGLPPPVPSTSGSSTQNEHCHKPNGPRVSSSQSTMAMSSLVPSASMEPITQNSAEGNNRRIMHNRSVSEPDFGRSPRQNQVDSSKESSADSQGKASSTSRFGRFRSQLFEKTLGLLKPWPDKQAKLGETNKFHYDEKLKRWVEEGVDPPAEEAALAPPPTMTTFQNGTPEYPSKSATKSAAKSEGSLTNGSSEFSSSKSSGIPPIPATSSQFSARGRTGVRARYVDTFNQGGGNPTKMFQSPSASSVKPVPKSNPKFFVPKAAPSADQPVDSNQENTQQQTTTVDENHSPTSTHSSFQPPSYQSSMQRFASMDNISRGRINPAFPGTSISPRSRRTASWGGGTERFSEMKPNGEVLPRPSSGDGFNEDLHEVEL